MAQAANATLKDYGYKGPFDPDRFGIEYANEFKNVPKYSGPSLPDLLSVLGKIGSDTRVSDIRWAAYILATVFVESSHTVRIRKQTKSPKGKVTTQALKVWRNYVPVEESGRGRGRDYGDSVKVVRLPTGNARVTERDGDQWEVRQTGVAIAAKGTRRMGFTPGSAVHATFRADPGDEHFYFGRGYVQLTWWHNYARAGVILGRGLDLLFHPERVNEPDMAYSILATGMCTGTIFANRRRLSQYFNDTLTDYVNARNMVNPGSTRAHKEDVAKIAERFEKILFSSKPAGTVATR